jgi:hypothetical protein
MERYIDDLQTRIKPKLRQIAQPSNRRHRHEQEHPGFKELLNQWKSIFQGVMQTMVSLSNRIEAAQDRPAAPKPPLRKPSEIIVSLKEYDYLLEHMKNSWEEVIVGGSYLYINVHDPNIKQWKMPVNAYIKSRPRPAPRPSRSSSYERRSSGSRMSEDW